MQDIAELERRVSAALERIGRGIDALGTGPAAGAAPVAVAPAPAGSGEAQAEIARLTQALEDERMANAQLTERLKALKAREGQARGVPQAKVDQMTRQLDVQGLELQRLKKTVIQLREQLRALREAAEAGMGEPHLINKAMLAELEALRAERSADLTEVDEILAALEPLIEEPAEDA